MNYLHLNVVVGLYRLYNTLNLRYFCRFEPRNYKEELGFFFTPVLMLGDYGHFNGHIWR